MRHLQLIRIRDLLATLTFSFLEQGEVRIDFFVMWSMTPKLIIWGLEEEKTLGVVWVLSNHVKV